MAKSDRDTIAQVHRFNDKVAVWTGGGTLYLSPDDARALSAALEEAANDIREEPKFSKSRISTFWLER